MSFGLDIQEIYQSRWVSVSKSYKFASLNESQSRHPHNIKVLLIYKQRNAKQKESKLDKFNQNQFIY